MFFLLRQSIREVTACLLAALVAIPQDLLAQKHVVSPSELQREVLAATQARERNLEKVKQFFSSQAAEKALKSADIEPARVKSVAAALSDEELARFASRTEKAQADFAAGRLADRDLLIIVLGIAALVLIIVAVR